MTERKERELKDILSLLPLKEGARTSVLSNQWKNIWCSHENLVFQFCTMLSRRYHFERSWTSDGLRLNHNLFIERVNMVLKQHSGLGVQIVALPPNFKGFQNLKRIKLCHTDVGDEDMQTLVSNCNYLEFLYIFNCGMLTILRTYHPSNQLKNLRIENCEKLKIMEINFGLTEFRTSLPKKTIKSMYLKHLRLELAFCVPERKVDMLDFACLLEAAPFLETVFLHNLTAILDLYIDPRPIDPRPVVAVPPTMFTGPDVFFVLLDMDLSWNILSKKITTMLYEIRREDVERLAIFEIMEVPWFGLKLCLAISD
uniref:At1g61320/AtMIF1 LRR domain-containing protein n=1 Tax=Leersia perrieri TaxID=77586 RepID=A0A0D9WVQ3_9ORYZ